MKPSRDEIIAMILYGCRIAKAKDSYDHRNYGVSSEILRLPMLPHQFRSEDPTMKSPSFADFLEAFGADSGPKFE